MRLSVPVPVAAVLASLALVAPAAAQEDKVYAPPGNSGIEEYLEVVPGAGGDKPSRGSGPDRGSPQTPADALGTRNAKDLNALGADGKATAAAAATGSPLEPKSSISRPDRLDTAGAAAGGSRSIATQANGDEVTSVARALSGEGGGLGIALPLLLGLSLVAMLAVGAMRLLRRS